MLIADSSISNTIQFPILTMLSNVNGKPLAKERKVGIYEIGHFGGSHFLRDYEHYPDGLSVEAYGVCDTPEQLLEKCPELEESDRRFVVTVHHLRKEDEPAEGGWRWHKWGPYIGEHEPQCEYLYDEPEIEEVYVYHIYEKV